MTPTTPSASSGSPRPEPVSTTQGPVTAFPTGAPSAAPLGPAPLLRTACSPGPQLRGARHGHQLSFTSGPTAIHAAGTPLSASPDQPPASGEGRQWAQPAVTAVRQRTLRHWVISDVHGCADSLQDLVSRLPSQDRLVLCGDVINRGPRIEAAMEIAWQLVESGRGVWLMGNHEQLLVQQLRGESRGERQVLAGSDTYRQLGGRSCRRWLERLEQLPLAYWSQGWVATHAGFDPLTWQPDLTVRMAFWQHYDGRFGQVIVGHTPAAEIRRIRSIVLIDTGACYGGALTAYCPETRQYTQVRGLSAGRMAAASFLPALQR